jgi:N-acetylglucosaminyldiphosphoundecaprenol N-acetyl-beta-D-mannosaminyltransferase
MDDPKILDVRVDATNYEESTKRVLIWATLGESRYVCAANVHMVMEASDSGEYANVVNSADLVTPDGMPLVWGLRLLGHKDQGRVCGPELMLRICAAAEAAGIPIGLYGGHPDVIVSLKEKLNGQFPTLLINYSYSPPYRPLTVEEDNAVVSAINASDARILFVGLGCPKQEHWMASHRDRISAVMIGVGAAFDFHAGRVRKSPQILQRLGLEWGFRLCMEPRRLWWRYAKHNPRFIFYFMLQLLQKNINRFCA